MERSASLYRIIGCKYGLAWCVCNRGAMEFHEGEYTKARQSCLNGLSLCRDLNDRMWIIYMLADLANVDRVIGNFSQAREFCREGLRLAREAGDGRWIMTFLLRLGDLECEIPDEGSAWSHYREALAVGGRNGLIEGIASVYRRLANLAASAGEDERAICLLCCVTLLGDLPDLCQHYIRPIPNQIDLETLRGRVELRLFESARKRAEAMSREEALSFAAAGG